MLHIELSLTSQMVIYPLPATRNCFWHGLTTSRRHVQHCSGAFKLYNRVKCLSLGSYIQLINVDGIELEPSDVRKSLYSIIAYVLSHRVFLSF